MNTYGQNTIFVFTFHFEPSEVIFEANGCRICNGVWNHESHQMKAIRLLSSLTRRKEAVAQARWCGVSRARLTLARARLAAMQRNAVMLAYFICASPLGPRG